MDIAELIEIALANSDDRRVEVSALEPADVAMEAVSGLAQLVSELVDNALSFSGPDDQVRVTGLHEQENYLVSISDRGVGIPQPLLAELNHALEDPNATAGSEPKLGIALVARLATRHGIGVRLVPGAPGTTARITVPGRLIDEDTGGQPVESGAVDTRLPPRRTPPDVFAGSDEDREAVGMIGLDDRYRSLSGVVAMTEEAKREAEAFLENVFAPLMESRGATERPGPPPNGSGNGPMEDPPFREPRLGVPERTGTVTALRVRVPGENFTPVEDEPSTKAAEGAVDIKSALSRYEQGRRSADESGHENS